MGSNGNSLGSTVTNIKATDLIDPVNGSVHRPGAPPVRVNRG